MVQRGRPPPPEAGRPLQGLLPEEATRKFPQMHQPPNRVPIQPLARVPRLLLKSQISVAGISRGVGRSIVKDSPLHLKELAIARIKVSISSRLRLPHLRTRSPVTHSPLFNASLPTSNQLHPSNRPPDPTTCQPCLVARDRRLCPSMPLLSNLEQEVSLAQAPISTARLHLLVIQGFLGISTISCLTWVQ